jgi:hypothetical protein
MTTLSQFIPGRGALTNIGLPPTTFKAGLAVVLSPGVTLAVRVAENHELEAQLTQQTIESGATISDHVILRPRMITLAYDQPNGFGGEAAALKAWEQVKTFWTGRQVVSVITEHDYYTNMIIERAQLKHDAPYRGAAAFTFSLRQVNFATLSYVPVPSSQLSGDVSQTASSQVTGGSAQPEVLPSAGSLNESDVFAPGYTGQ